jgi:two-component system, cell cycle response regulator
MGIRILVADDEPTIRSVIRQVLEDDGYDVTDVPSGDDALAAFRKCPFPIVLTDIVMGRMSGLDLLREIKLLDTDALVIVMTSQASLETATVALRAGAHDYLTKPFEDISQISNVVRRSVEKLDLMHEKEEMVERLKRSAHELETLNSQLKEMAVRDGLTGLFNHRHFREALENEMARSRRHSREFSLVFIDVDHFKHFNDTHGHLQGDRVLKGLAWLIRDRCRSTTLAARYGGEEFVLLIPETGKEGARTLAEGLRRAIEEHPFEGRETQPAGKVTLSLGVATHPEDGTDSVALIASADRAVYQAKNAGRNRVCCAGAPAPTPVRAR